VEPIDDELQLALTKYKDKFVVGYIGTIGLANALDVYVEAASLLHDNDNDNIIFLVVGDGSEKSNLCELVKRKSLSNVVFFDGVPKKQVQNVIKSFDVCYLGWRDKSLYNYGIGANKIPEYFYSGKPILHSYSGEKDPVAQFSAGITVPAEDANKIAETILIYKGMSKENILKIGKRGHQTAINFYGYDHLTDELINIVNKEILSSCKANEVKGSWLSIFPKYLMKIKGYILN
jgi:glycosyltransferase involved in cell wall biosynthesis